MTKKKPIKSKRKTCDVFHQKPYSKTNRSFRCSSWSVVRFFLLSTFENFFLTMKNSYHKALSVPSRRVNYYKHVKFDLRDNITSRNVNKKVRILREPAAGTRCSGNSTQNPVLKTSRNGYVDLRRTRKKKIIVLVNEFDQAFRFCTKPHRK